MTTINPTSLQITDLPDTNKKDADLRQIRQQVADRLGVSTQQVRLEYDPTFDNGPKVDKGKWLATIQGGDQVGNTVDLTWADEKDKTRVKTYASAPPSEHGVASITFDGKGRNQTKTPKKTADPAPKTTDTAPKAVEDCVDFGVGDGKGPLTVGRLVHASSDTGHAFERREVVPALQNVLSRELQVPSDQIEMRWETTDGETRIAVRKEGDQDWRPLEFGTSDEAKAEAKVVLTALKSLDVAEPTLSTTEGTPVVLDGKSKLTAGAPKSAAQLTSTISDYQVTSLAMPTLTGSREDKLSQVMIEVGNLIQDWQKRQNTGKKQELIPNDRIVLRVVGNEIQASVIPATAAGRASERFSEAWVKKNPIVIQPANPEDAKWLISEIRQSAGDTRLNTLGARSENPDYITVREFTTDMGQDAAIANFKNDLKAALRDKGFPKIDVSDITLQKNEQGILQAVAHDPVKKDHVKVFDVRINDDYSRNLVYRLVDDMPTKGLLTFGESKWTNRIGMDIGTGFPDAKSNTVFTESADTRYYFGNKGWYAGGGVTMTQGLQPGVHDPFTLQEGRLKLGYRGFLDLGVKFTRGADGKYSIGTDGLSSDWADRQIKKFGDDLMSKKPYAVWSTVGAVAVVGGVATGVALGSKKEFSFNLPLAGTIYNKGILKVQAGINGDLSLGGEKHIGYTFKGAKTAFTETFGSGTVINERVEYEQDFDKTRGGNKLHMQVDGTAAYRTGYMVKTSLNTSTGKFDGAQTYISQGFKLSPGLGMTVAGGVSLDAKGKFQSPLGSISLNYQRGAWNFYGNVSGAMINTTPDIPNSLPNGPFTTQVHVGASVRF